MYAIESAYVETTMFTPSLTSGDRFPCTIEGADATAFVEKSSTELLVCIFEEGSADMKRPMKIYITNFAYRENKNLKIHILYYNPPAGITPVFDLKAFGNTLAGEMFRGE